MNIHTRGVDQEPSDQELLDAIRLVRDWLGQDVSSKNLDADIDALMRALPKKYPEFKRDYPKDFKVSSTYKDSLPDLQNGPSSLIKGANREIQQVGISNFRLPIRFQRRDGGEVMLETSVTGSVSLEADKKGINMSRIMRSFYKHADQLFSFDVVRAALNDYKTDLESFDARIMMRFSYPVAVKSLRSGLTGYQYYDLALEMIERAGVQHQIVHLDYVYSSTCPCSLELSEHARETRGQLATPHSQRSVARISVAKTSSDKLWFEDLIDMCRLAVPTETQVMVKREDEQAFAELNAANPIFVEDAARLFAHHLENDGRVGDFRVVASHQESLHSHDAISVLTHGTTFDAVSIDPKLFETLIHRG